MNSTRRPSCSIAKGPFCVNKKSINDMDSDFKEAYQQYIEMMYPEVLADTISCVKDVFFHDYWVLKGNVDEADEKFGLYLFLAVATGAIIIIAILLLVIYIRRKSGDSEEEQLEEIE